MLTIEKLCKTHDIPAEEAQQIEELKNISHDVEDRYEYKSKINQQDKLENIGVSPNTLVGRIETMNAQLLKERKDNNGDNNTLKIDGPALNMKPATQNPIEVKQVGSGFSFKNEGSETSFKNVRESKSKKKSKKNKKEKKEKKVTSYL
jgi:hypothetical protein